MMFVGYYPLRDAGIRHSDYAITFIASTPTMSSKRRAKLDAAFRSGEVPLLQRIILRD